MAYQEMFCRMAFVCSSSVLGNDETYFGFEKYQSVIPLPTCIFFGIVSLFVFYLQLTSQEGLLEIFHCG